MVWRSAIGFDCCFSAHREAIQGNAQVLSASRQTLCSRFRSDPRSVPNTRMRRLETEARAGLIFGLPASFRGTNRSRPAGIWNIIDSSSGRKDFRTKQTQRRRPSALRKGTSMKRCERCGACSDDLTPVTIESVDGEQKEMNLCPKCMGDAFSISTNIRYGSTENVPKRSWWQFWKKE
jgi:hypothetical protein